MDRRSVIKNAGIAGILAAGAAPAVHAQAAIRWRLASSFPKSLDTIHGAADTFAKAVKAMSGGKFEISGTCCWRNHACVWRGRRRATRLRRNGSHSPLLFLW
jgi:TRAP-type mannitol/chloroaromatic compound transport system substrate-binding protein